MWVAKCVFKYLCFAEQHFLWCSILGVTFLLYWVGLPNWEVGTSGVPGNTSVRSFLFLCQNVVRDGFEICFWEDIFFGYSSSLKFICLH